MSYIIATWNKAAQLVQSQHWNCGHSELCWHSAARSLYYATIIQYWVKGKCQFPALDGEITLVYVLHKATFTLCTERCILPLYPHHLQLCIAYLVKNQLSTIFLSLFSLTNCKSAGFQHQTDGSPLPNVVAPTLTLLQIPHVSVRALFTLNNSASYSARLSQSCSSIFPMLILQLMAYSICQIRIWIWVGFSETIHSVCESKSRFANPVLTRIH